jgi:hypothetical protein
MASPWPAPQKQPSWPAPSSSSSASAWVRSDANGTATWAVGLNTGQHLSRGHSLSAQTRVLLANCARNTSQLCASTLTAISKALGASEGKAKLSDRVAASLLGVPVGTICSNLWRLRKFGLTDGQARGRKRQQKLTAEQSEFGPETKIVLTRTALGIIGAGRPYAQYVDECLRLCLAGVPVGSTWHTACNSAHRCILP